MPANLLDGKLLARKLNDALKTEVQEIRKKSGRVPTLKSIMIGASAGALAYAESQKKTADAVGIEYELITLPDNTSENQFLKTIFKYNDDPSTTGIIIQKPLPSKIDALKAVNLMDPLKDVEGVCDISIGKLILGEPNLTPCTPAAVMELLKSSGVSLKGKEAVVVGRSDIVGKPVALLLLSENATVTICHSATGEDKLTEHLKRADIVIAAVGKPSFIKGQWIKPGALVVDVGINRVGEKIVGDVDFEAAKQKASFITPVPGGVGPVTVVMLMQNCLKAFKNQMKFNSRNH